MKHILFCLILLSSLMVYQSLQVAEADGYPKLANYLCSLGCEDTAVAPSGTYEQTLDNWDLLIMIMDNQAYPPAAAKMKSWRQTNNELQILAYVDPIEFNLNALELDVDSGGELNRLEYDLLQEIIENYPEWWLLEPGSTLSESIDATQNIIPVENADHFTVYARNAGEEDNPDPQAPNYIMIGSEHMLITGINSGNNTIEVERNLPDLPSSQSHPAGSRVAAHVVYWEGTWMMNCSDTCPEVAGEKWNTFLPGWMQERFFETPHGALIWTGIYLDCIWWDMTWLGTGAEFVDLDNDGTGETSSSFNELWQSGLSNMLQSVRSSISTSKSLIINGDPEPETYIHLNNTNGQLLEQFPNKWTWDEYMQAYFHWNTNAFPPRLNVIDCSFFDHPGPNEKENYPLMRLGLTSCLMGSGFYGFDNGDWGHDKYWWYDEYDNAGKEKGYLGQPVSSPESVNGCLLRRFENGIAVCNPTNVEKTIDLGLSYRKIAGIQDPFHNDGSTTSQLNIPANDGYILLTEDGYDLSLSLEVSQDIFYPDDEFFLWATIKKPVGKAISFDEYILLDVYGNYFFWPTWIPFPSLDKNTYTMDADEILLEQDILEFLWPECSGSAAGLWFYGLLMEPDSLEIVLSDPASASFGYSCI